MATNYPDRRPVIETLVSLREAGRRCKTSPAYVKAVAEGLRVRMYVAAQSHCMTEKDFLRVKREVDRRRLRYPEPETAAAG